MRPGTPGADADSVVGDRARPTQLGSIREIHRAHELRTADARLIRRARVAITDRSVKKADVLPLLQRCGAEVVKAADDATIVIAASGETDRRKRRGAGLQRVVDEAGLRALVAAYEAVYLPAALTEATRRARQRLEADLVGEQLAREQQAREKQRRTRTSRRGAGAEAPRPKPGLTEAELTLQEHVRGLRAKSAGGPLARH
jgi:hypothetical protein